MADLSVTPVAAQIKPVPNMSLGDMVNLARGAQAYQQSEQMNPLLLQQQQQTVDTGRIALTLEQQKEAERQRLIPFLQNPQNIMTADGRVDINKLNADVLKLAPLTGSEFMQKFTQLSTLQTQSDQAIQSLTNDERNVVASFLGAYGRAGVTDRARVYDGLNNLGKQYQSPSMQRLIDSYKGQLELADQRADLPSLLMGAATQVMTAAQQQEAFAPQISTFDTGAATYPVVKQPSIEGRTPSLTIGGTPFATRQLGPQDTFKVVGNDPLTNLPIVEVKGENGVILGRYLLQGTPDPRSMPGQFLPSPTGGARPSPQFNARPPTAPAALTPVVPIPPGETQDTVNLANQVRIKALESATQVPMQNFNNNEIIKLADEALTGRGAGTLANLTGGYAVFNAVGLGGGNATALNQLGHYMALQTASLAQSAGLGTDAARNIAAESTGTINWTPDAIKKTARVNRSLATATDLFNQGIQSAFQRTKNPLSAREFQNRWSQTADINAIRLFDAMRNNDPDGFREVVDSAGGPQSPGFNRLKTKVEEIKRLVGMQ